MQRKDESIMKEKRAMTRLCTHTGGFMNCDKASVYWLTRWTCCTRRINLATGFYRKHTTDGRFQRYTHNYTVRTMTG